MRFMIDDLEVLFPYDYVYPEQYEYMCLLKQALDAGQTNIGATSTGGAQGGHACLEMPTGTGKTVTLLSLITSYQFANPRVARLVYCTRTVPEIDKVLEEAKVVLDYRNKELGTAPSTLALGLSSRRNMCVHPEVSADSERSSCDSKCRNLTAPWVRDARQSDASISVCQFYEDLENLGAEGTLPIGCFSLADIKTYGQERGLCPYFLARQMMARANIVVYNYQYLLDPKISNLISKELCDDSVVVFDEAHNIDNVCIEVMTVAVNQETLNKASANLAKLSTEVAKARDIDEQRLRTEFNSLLQGLSAGGGANGTDAAVFANPVLPPDLVDEAIPGNIRKAQNFISVMRRVVHHLKERLHCVTFTQETPNEFRHRLYTSTGAAVGGVDARTLKFCSSLLSTLFRTLQISDMQEFTPIQLVADLATLVGTYTEGFAVIIEPIDERYPGVANPVLQLCCNDAALAMKPVLEKFRSVIITSGTLSPISFYEKILGIRPVVAKSLPMSLSRNCIHPVVVARGSDQVPISTKFEVRSDAAVVNNYAHLLVELTAIVPDGMVCFFTSYRYMEEIINAWHKTKMLEKICANKILFIETSDMLETSLALQNYRRACDSGRGAIFFSVARGKVAEGIDFDRHYGRCVVMLGVPFQYTESNILKARLAYMREKHKISEGDFLTFDAIRQAAQCLGRVVRSKADYGIMVLADQRYSRADKRDKLPKWVRDTLQECDQSLSSDEVLVIAKQFLREMAQPLDQKAQLGQSLWSLEHLQAHKEKMAAIASGADL